jgi:hypothetical protein
MHDYLLVTSLLVAIAAAVRSTWSPCGWSMLSTITPLGEQGRGRRFGPTATWFVSGAVVGGATLGGLIAALSEAFAEAHLNETLVVVLASLASLACAASDARLGGWSLPIHRRQVNEDWLDLYRPWVYGAGFGWQIGTGLATYITTAAVYLMILDAALLAHPLEAFLIGTAFGTVRGVAVLAGRRLDSPEALRRFHARFASAGEASRRAVVALQALTGIALLAVISLPLGAAAATVVGCSFLVLSGRRSAAAA